MKNCFVVLLLLTGCTLEPEFLLPKTEMAKEWRTPQTGEEVTAEWWKKYDSVELTTLIDKALQSNKDLAAGLERIEQARANSKIAGANLWPRVDASGSASKDFTHNRGGGTRESYGAGVNVGYEVDLFGRNRSAANAAEMRQKASSFDYHALELITVADTANFYALYLSLNDRVNIAEKNLANGREILRIVQALTDEGRLSSLELSQQKSSIASLETAITNLKNQRDVARSQLAVLTGQTPQAIMLKGVSIAELKAPAVKPVQPGELLERRPDIKASEASLKAANIDIGAAKAEFYPTLQIGVNPGIAASGFSDPITFATGILASVTQPIFRGGALQGNLDYTEARQRELAANYGQLVLSSLKEVEDALSGSAAARESIVSSEMARNESQKAYDIAKIRYDEGRTDFQALLNTQSSLFQTEDNYYQSRLNEITTSVDLFKALGGGWKEE